MFAAIVITFLLRVFSLSFGYIFPSTSSVADKFDRAVAHLMHALIGKLELKEVWDYSYLGFFGKPHLI